MAFRGRPFLFVEAEHGSRSGGESHLCSSSPEAAEHYTVD